jgi:large subunit ribosomal protein L18
MKKNLTPRDRRKTRIRKKVKGTSERPRLSVFRSNRHLVLQAVDDVSGKTIVSAQTVEKELQGRFAGNNMEAATGLAATLAERAKAKGITKMVFDRSGYAYHGRVKKVAESLRENGITI